MADKKVVEDKKPAASLLPVTVAEKEEAPSLPDDVLLVVSLWAFVTTGIFLGCGALVYALNLYHIPPSSWMTGGPKLAGAAAAEERALRHGVLWSSAAAAAVAALALLLPARRCHRIRRALAYAALAATAAAHLMLAMAVTLLLTAKPGGIIFWIFALFGTVDILFMAAGDIFCFLALVLL